MKALLVTCYIFKHIQLTKTDDKNNRLHFHSNRKHQPGSIEYKYV